MCAGRALVISRLFLGRLGGRFGDYLLKSVGQVVSRPCNGGARSCMQGRLEPFGNLAGFFYSSFFTCVEPFSDVPFWVGSRY